MSPFKLVQFGWFDERYASSFFQGWRNEPSSSDMLITTVHVPSRTSLNSMRKLLFQGFKSQVFRVSCWPTGLKCMRVEQFLKGVVYRLQFWNWDLIFLILLIKRLVNLSANASWDELAGMGLSSCPFISCWCILKSICNLLLLDSICELICYFLDWHRCLR